MTNRPFHPERPLPEIGPDFPTAIPALLAECQAERAVLDSLSPLTLAEMKRPGRGEIEALKVQYLAEGRYSEAFLERLGDLSRHIYRLFKFKTAWLKELRSVPTATLSGALLQTRQQKLAWWNAVKRDRWEHFQSIKYDLHHLDPNNVEQPSGGNNCSPDNLSDGLSQGIGVRKYL